MTVSPLVSTEWLADALRDSAKHRHDPDLRVIDLRWYLLDKTRHGRGEYLRGHIPGAIFMDVDRDLAAPFGQGPGRHPLPRPDVFVEAASRAGIGPDTYVVAYDDSGGASAARLWWLLRYCGHARVSLLDGGIVRWIGEGRPLETEVPTVPRVTFTPHPHPDRVVDQETVNALRNDPAALVLDVRAAERYRGEVEPIDPRAGHIPGAKSAPYAGNLRAPDDPRFLEPAQLRARFESLGASRVERIVSYCGSGVNACQNILALHLAGFDNALLYEGSWSDWCRNPERPAAVGPNP
jgi:thiosulfate/3-mercaptopyruvate sulfurtransferase